MLKKLHLHLKYEYFDAIKANEKFYEYRLFDKWVKKFIKDNNEGIQYSEIVLYRAYPKKTDLDSIITRPWKGWGVQTITHKHFGKDPVKVFAIIVN